MNQKQFKTATEAVPEAPLAPPQPKLGNADKLLQRIRTQAPHLLTRKNFVLLHTRQCACVKGLLCDCDVRACVDGSTLRLRD